MLLAQGRRPSSDFPRTPMDQLSQALRSRHYTRRTEQTYYYCNWVRRFIHFHNVRHPKEMAEPEINAFLTPSGRQGEAQRGRPWLFSWSTADCLTRYFLSVRIYATDRVPESPRLPRCSAGKGRPLDDRDLRLHCEMTRRCVELFGQGGDAIPSVNPVDLLIALLYSRHGEAIEGTVRLMKLLFLLVKEGGFARFDNDYVFRPYDLGPWSPPAIEFAESLAQHNYVKVEEREFRDPEEVVHEAAVFSVTEPLQTPPQFMRVFELTEKGHKIAEKVTERLSPEEHQTLDRLKARFGRMPLPELIEYVYGRYPEYAVKSKWRGRRPRRSLFGVAPDLPPFEEEPEDIG